MVGKIISHYKIIEKLGEGGMGVVYKAEDSKLKRTVALKFLPPDLTRDPEAKERFIREAQAAASLEHNNICSIYQINETEDGQLFIVMACYEGQTLKDKIVGAHYDAPGRPIPKDQAIGIAIQISEGLTKAHEKGIVHRDIKPANILITDDGIVKILDFGLAKLAGQAQLTKDSSTLGTVAYMFPEQAKGEDVDHRTDIWSLGVVLYEMLTGELPFKGDYEQAVIYSILNEEPKPIENAPPNLQPIIRKTLQKNSDNRYQNLNTLIEDLNRPHIEELYGEKCKKSIIVLPFTNMSPDPEQEYFNDGLTEEIITDLSSINDLLVISRSSAMTFKGTNKKIKEIANEVNVRYVLEGSVRKAGNNLRITAQLIDANTDTHLWAEKYSGTLDEIFDIQEKVSRTIVDSLQLKLSPEEDAKIIDKPVDNVHAYECYLRARQGFWKWDEKSLDFAIQQLNNGIKIVGENAMLYAGLGFVNFQIYNYGIKPQEKYLDKAVEYANKIFELEHDSPEGYRLLGFVAIFRDNMKKSSFFMKKTLAIHPNDTEALVLYAISLVFFGKTEEARSQIERLLALDPLTWLNYLPLIFLHIMQGNYGSALEQCQKTYLMEPNNPYLKFMYAYCLSYNKSYNKSFEFLDEAAIEGKDFCLGSLSKFVKYAFQNEKEKALRSITPELSEKCEKDIEIAWQMSECYSMINAKQKALNCLEKAINRGLINYPFLNEHNLFLNNIRDEDWFKKLMERVKFEWENFEV